jgi:hypothetical protein
MSNFWGYKKYKILGKKQEFRMLKSLVGIVDDAVAIVTAPVKIAIDTTRMVTKPVADVVTDLAKKVEELSHSDDD